MSIEASHTAPELAWVRRSFGAAAAGYDGYADLQRQVGRDLLALLPAQLPEAATLLDVGAGTGFCAAELSRHRPRGRVIALDLAEEMLQVAKGRLEGLAGAACVGGRAEALPVRAAAADLVFTNLALQWCPRLDGVFGEFRRVLRPGGAVLFSTFAESTLHELREAWAAADGYSHVNRFVALADIRAALAAAGFGEICIAAAVRTLAYPDVPALMRQLKGLGAHNVTAGRPRHLTGKRALRRMIEAYPRTDGGEGIVASFETLIGTARVLPP